MVIKELLSTAVNILKNSGLATPQLDASVLLCFVLKCDRVHLIVNENKSVTAEHENTYLNLIKKRKENMPLAYIINEKEFMSLDFYVNENVLIPRPDTEILVEYVLDSVFKKDKILDLCCGSGCIGISLAHYLKNTSVHFADISDKALEVTQINAKNLLDKKINIKFLKLDILNQIPDEKYDLIVSNPPYIETKVLKTLEKNVIDYEPELALAGGDDGLVFYRRISDIAKQMLTDDGHLVFEIGENQGVTVPEIMSKCGFFNIEVINDLAGRNRVVKGSLKP